MKRYRSSRYRSRRNRRVASFQTFTSNDAAEFVRREFFNLSRAKLESVIGLYGRKYGDGPRRYLQGTYDKWRKGEVRISRQNEDRILHCVPRFLSDRKQFDLLSVYIPKYMRQLRETIRDQHVGLSNVSRAYSRAAHRCYETEPELDWFAKDVFDENELETFAEVIRYSMLDRLHRSYSAVRNDLMKAVPVLMSMDTGISISYSIGELACEVTIDAQLPRLPDTAFELSSPPELIERHQEQYERMIFDHRCEMLTQAKEQEAKDGVAQLDLAILRETIESLSRSESMESDIEIQGAGGVFRGRIWRKNLGILRLHLFTRVALAVISTGAAAAGVWLLWVFETQCWIACGGFLAFFAVIGIWQWAFEKYEEVRDYERCRTARLAEDGR